MSSCTRSRAQMDKKEKTTYAVTVKDGKVTSGSGKLSVEDIGRYSAYPLTVLTNGNTASAAELFTANIRDHKPGAIVGTNTFGKGIMQTTYPLSRYGYDGALKLTTQYYDPPVGRTTRASASHRMWSARCPRKHRKSILTC